MTLKNIIYPTIIFCLLSCSSKKLEDEQSGEKTTTNVEDKTTEMKVRLLEYQDFNYEFCATETLSTQFYKIWKIN
jgi:hypothetical protein